MVEVTAGTVNTSVGRWVRIAVAVFGVLALAFGVVLLVNSQALIGNAHKRNAHRMEVISGVLEAWPRTIADIAAANYTADKKKPLFEKGHPFLNPELGQVTIAYRSCRDAPDATPDDRFFPRGTRPGEGPRFALTGVLKEADDVCFSTTVPLDRLVASGRTTSDFSHLLLAAPDGTVVEQFGNGSLPMTKLTDLRPVSNFARRVTDAVLDAKNAPEPDGSVALGAAPGVAIVRVADAEYYAYVRPFRLDRMGRACPPDRASPTQAPGDISASPRGDVTDNSSAAARPPSDATAKDNAAVSKLAPPVKDATCQFYAVGLAEGDALRREWLRPPPLLLAGTGLAVLLVLALLPVVRLLLISGTESIAAHEVAAIAFGTYAATAIATLMVLFAVELAGERNLARTKAETAAVRLARETGVEVGTLLFAARKCSDREEWSLGRPMGIPVVYETGFFGQDGKRRNAEAPCAAKREALPPATDIGSRSYFRDLAGPSGLARYAIGQVKAQNDGIEKTVVVLTLDDQKQEPTEWRAFLASTVIRSLARPVLDVPQRFMLVDASKPDLPVLFHHERGRAGLEALGDQVRSIDAVRRALRQLRPVRGGEAEAISFARRYDGRVVRFSAAAVANTPWVVLVYHRIGEVDAVAAQTVLRATGGWASATVLFLAGCGLILLVRPSAWEHLWPFAEGAVVYRDHARWALAAAGGITAAVLAAAFFETALAPAVVAMAVLLGTGLALRAARALNRLEPTGKSLTLEAENGYRRFVFAMLACVAVAPTIAFWADARASTRHRVDAIRVEAAATAVSERAAYHASLREAFETVAADDRWTWHEKPIAKGKVVEATDASATRLIQVVQGGLPAPRVRHCQVDGKVEFFCWTGGARVPTVDAIGVAPRGLALPSPGSWVVVLALTAALAMLIYAVVHHGLRTLTGFGIPLDAVTWPRLIFARNDPRPDDNEVKLAPKSLLVAPQQAVRDRLAQPGEAIVANVIDDLPPLPALPEVLAAPVALPPIEAPPQAAADGPRLPRLQGLIRAVRALFDRRPVAAAAGPSAASPPAPRWLVPGPAGRPRLVIYGLELVLRDGDRRRQVLEYLERAAALLADRARLVAPSAADAMAVEPALVIIAEMSPLERILDAVDTYGRQDAQQATAREELRWARLFQDFTTFSFAPIDKIDDAHRDMQGLSEPQRRLVEELRWLPGSVIDSVIGDRTSSTLGQGEDSFPVLEKRYREHYTPIVARWARVVNPVTEVAAIDFLRANIIEHYEQSWAASSSSERVLLDAVARGGFVNMRKAVALQSLVRRGLIILDPVPRLMNRSFGLFIRQTERPGRLVERPGGRSKSAWSTASRPLAVVLPVLVLGLTAAAAQAGQELTAIVSLLAAGAPALIGAAASAARKAG